MTKLHWIILAIVAVAVMVALIVVLNPHESKTIRTAAGELSHKQGTKAGAPTLGFIVLGIQQSINLPLLTTTNSMQSNRKPPPRQATKQAAAIKPKPTK